ncbi:MAG: NAD-dependent deacylase [Candidatus Thermoplasmatota archaeon]
MDKAVKAIKRADRIAVLTGAGMSVESGIAPFRGEDGLWNEFDPQEYATLSAFKRNPEKSWELFRLQIEECLSADPHEGHRSLVELEDHGLKAVVTQNVDGLHQEAGSETVLELHGTLAELVCPSCGSREETEDHLDEIIDGNIPRCECGSMLRPDVVLFGESLPRETLRRSQRNAEETDLLISIGTSAVVQPAASIPTLAERTGSVLIEINPEKTPLTPRADHFLEGKAGEKLPELVEQVKG